MEMAKIQDAGLRMKLQHDQNKFAAWVQTQIGRIFSPCDLRALKTRQIRLTSFVSGRENFAGRERRRG